MYDLLFEAPVQFGAAVASLELDAALLQLPVLRDEQALNAMLQRALPIQVRPYTPGQPLVQRVRQALASHPQCGHTAASLCAQLHLAPRSLHRQLQQQGSSLQQPKTMYAATAPCIRCTAAICPSNAWRRPVALPVRKALAVPLCNGRASTGRLPRSPARAISRAAPRRAGGTRVAALHCCIHEKT